MGHESFVLEQTLDQAFGRYLLAVERNEDVEPDAFVRGYPEVAEPLRACLATLGQVQRMAGPMVAEQSPAAASVDTAKDLSVAATIAAAEANPATEQIEAALPLGGTFGRYRIQRQLGRGAMGAVYLAYDEQLHRQVALKTPRFVGGHAHELTERFYREARAAAQLRSPHICPVYDVAQIGGVHYISMAYIEGPTLSEAIRDRSLSDPRQIAEVVRKLALALQKAHNQGIVHRDLKPGNVMLDSEGEPIVTDFGLARQIDDSAELTQRGTLVGSPAYMSPEQIDGAPENIGPASDIYSLGVILYELLAGRPPFNGSVLSILSQIACDEPPRPSQLVPGLQAAAPLEDVCLRMIAKRVEDRYRSMSEVADALLPLTHPQRPVPAAPAAMLQPGTSHRRPFARRLALVAVLIGVLGVLAGVVFVVTDRGRLEIRSQVEDVQIVLEQDGSELVVLDLQTGTQVRWLPSGEYELKAVGDANGVQVDKTGFQLTRGGKVIVNVSRTGGKSAVGDAGVLERPDASAAAGDVLTMYGAKPDWMTRVLFSRDGRHAISTSSEIYVWDLATGKLVRKFGKRRGDTWALALSPDGRNVLASDREQIGLWELETGKLLRESQGHLLPVWSVAFAPDGSRFASAGEDSWIRVWNSETGQPLGEIPTPGVTTRSLAFSPDGKYLASGHFANKPPGAATDVVRLWNAETLRLVRVLPETKWNVCSVTFSPDGKTLASSSLEPNASIRTWDVASGRPGRIFQGHAGAEYAVYSLDGRLLVSCGYEASETNTQLDRSVRVWDAATGAELQRWIGHTAGPLCVAVSPDGRSVLSSGKDSTVRLWRLPEDPQSQRLAQAAVVIASHDAPVSCVVFSPDGQRIASTSSHGSVLIHDPHTGRQVRDLRGHQGPVPGLSFSADGAQLLSAGFDRTVRLWDVGRGAELRQYPGHTGLVHAAIWSPDGKLIASCTHEGTQGAIWIRDAKTGEVVRKFEGVSFQPFDLVWSPDGSQLLSGAHDGVLRLWDASQGTVVRAFRGHQDWIIRMAFSPDGKSAASASKDGTARLWDVATGVERRRFTGHTDLVGAVAISPDGRRILTGSLDQTMRLWDAMTGEELQRYQGHTGEVTRVAFSPKTPQCVSSSTDRTIRVWTLPGE